MPDTPYLDSGLQTGFSDTDLFQLKLENMNNFDRIINQQQPYLTGKFDFYQDPSAPERIDETQKIIDDINTHSTDFSDYLTHPDKRVRDIANGMVYNKIQGNPFYKRNVGGVEVRPYDEGMDKFLSKDFGFRFERDNEDYYYRNVYMQDGWFMRNIVKNPVRFLGRVIVPGVLKLGEGLGYVGSMLTSIGSDNYWADVADNGFSNWLEGLEQDFKDQVLPVYKQAGFDDKGFFSKLLDWSFWNDSVADGVAFMASAAVPGMGFAKLGTFGKFGQAFSTTAKLGKFASKVGLGSWAELSSWTFNTAMEASQEGAGVFKEMKRRLELERAQGLNNLSDEDIKARAGSLAANTIAGNFAVLGLSNAFENTLFFKPFKHVEGRAAVQLTEDFTARSRALDNLASRNPFKSALSRTSFYGSRAFTGLVAEGLWEENAQLAIQRINQGDNEGRNFFEQLAKQTVDAFSGKDKEAMENIGIGALIGIGASTVLSKAANERRKIIDNTQQLLDAANEARHNLFSVNDVYERDADNNVIFDGNVPRTDAKKLATKQKELEALYGKFSLTNLEEYYKSPQMQYQAKSALADYVRSLSNLGITGISDKMSGINPQTATLFGMNPTDLKEQTKDFASLAKSFEDISRQVDSLPEGKRPPTATEQEYTTNERLRRGMIYDKSASSVIMNQFVANETTSWLKSLNEYRNLNNASISQFPVDQLNTLIYQQRLNEQVINSPAFKEMSEFEKQYHLDRNAQLEEQINNYKTNNELALSDSKQTPNGYYTPTIKNADGSVTEVKFDTKSNQSQQKVADYQNIIDKNNWIVQQLSDENGYENYEKMRDTPLMQALRKAAAQQATKQQFVEETEGDFDKILDHVKRTVFSEDYTPSAETQELLAKYPEVVSRLLDEYQEAAENNRVATLTARLNTLKEQQTALGNQVRTYRQRLEDKKTELEILREELENVENKKPVDQKRIANAINLLQKDITKVENWYNKQLTKLGDIENQISVLEQEIESGDLTGLRNALSELRQERDWVRNKINETKSLLDRLKKLVQDIRRIAYKLFGGKSEFVRNLEKGRWEAVNYATEIENNKTALQDAKDTLAELNNLIKDIESTYEANKAELNEIINNTNQYFKEQYQILTKQQAPKTEQDAEEDSISKGLTADKQAFPVGDNSEGKVFDEETGFDGNSYQRPLQTKFYTTTFPWIGEGQPITNMSQAPKDVQDHAAFLDYLTEPNNGAEIKKKLGKGQLRALVVTKNNVEALGLQDVLAERSKFFAIEDPALTHIEVIPVIEEGGYMYYVDTQLNRLGRVDEKAPDNMVRRSLRTAKFTEAEQTQYLDKYTEEDMALAVQAATDWRKEVLEMTIKEPTHNFEFSVTRGLPVKQRMQDGKPAQNPVIGNLIPANQVNGQTVRVYTENNQPLINGENILVPPGRPFIYTDNGVHEQLHAADNQPLTQSQVATVSAVMQEALADHMEKVLNVINNNPTFDTTTKEVNYKAIKNMVQKNGLSNLNDQEKRRVFLAVTKVAKKEGIKLFNSNYTNFLSHVIYGFGPLAKDTVAGENQIFLQGFKLFFGNGGPAVDITQPEQIQNPEIQEFLSRQNHNIKYFKNEEVANRPFIEYYLDGNKINQRQWKTYSHYLLSDKLPNGSERTEIPVTTAIQTQEQKDAEQSPNPYKYESRGITLFTETVPITKKGIVKGEEEEGEFESAGISEQYMEQPPVQQQAAPKGTVDPNTLLQEVVDGIFASYGRPQDMKAEAKPNPPTVKSTPPTKSKEEDDAAKLLNEVVAGIDLFYQTKNNKPNPNDYVPEYNEEEEDQTDNSTESDDLPPFPYEEDNYRIVTSGVFKTEEDLNGVIADIKRMLPQFPVVRLEKAIRTSAGLEAFGQFVNNSILLWEMAEKGTGYHEAFEAVANRLLTDAEWKAMYKEFNSRKGYFTDRNSGQRLRFSDANEYQAKEQLAEEFMDYKLTGKQPSYPQTKSFFRIILDFIKALFGANPTIQSIFSKIEKGKFATRTVRANDRFSNNYRVKLLKDLPVKAKRDLYEGATAVLFNNVFFTPESLTQLDEIDLTDEQVYEPIRAEFQRTLDVLADRFKRETDEKEKLKYATSAKNVNYALNNWAEFVEGHKQSIKHLRIKFEQSDIEQTDRDKDEQNRNDYLQDIFKTDGKRSASKSVRFLFHTLLNLKFDEKGETKDINGRIAGKTKVLPSSVFMRSLVNYDSFMLKALENFQNLGSFDRIEERMAELAGIREIEETKNPEARAKLIASMDKEKATWTQLYGRLFGFSDKIDEEAAWNLRVKFFNYVSKHSPEPYLFINGGGTSTIISSTRRNFFETITRKIGSSISLNSNLIFRREKNAETGLQTFVPIPEFKRKITPAEFTQAKQERFLEFLGLYKKGAKDNILSPAYIKSLSKEDKGLLQRMLLRIRNAMTDVSTPVMNIKGLNIFGYTSDLINFLDKRLNIAQKESQFFNIENQPQQRHIIPSFASRVIGEMNNVRTLKELYEKYPQTATLFAADSIVMKKMFDENGNRTDYSISLGYMEGVKDLEDQEGTKTSRLEGIDKYYLQFNASLSGLYYSLPADSETEWIFDFGEFVPFSENMLQERGRDIIEEFFLPKLKSEIDTVKADNNRLLQLKGKHASTGEEIGKSLRFFKDILQYTANGKTSTELLTEVQEALKTQTSEQILTSRKFKNRIINAIGYYLQFETANTIAALAENRIITKQADGYYMEALNNAFVDKYSASFSQENGAVKLSEAQLQSLVQYQKINTVLANMESFKVLFGDPAQYKDFEKRAKSLFGPVEQAYFDTTGAFNNWLNKEKNKVVLGEQEVELAADDIFRTNFDDKITSRTINDFEVVDVATVNDLVALQSEFAKRFINDYEKSNEADGQSIGTLQFARQLMIKSGWRWTKAHEDFFQYDTALMRQEMSKNGEYKYSSKELEKLDKKIVENFSGNIPLVAITPIKTLMPSVDENGQQTLMKHSVHFLSYSVAKNFELLDLYKDMLKRGDALLNFKSAQKVGLETDNSGKVTNYYKDPFTKVDLGDEKLGNVQQLLDFKTIGIQVETQSDKWGQTLGSQLTKLSNLNLFSNGVPVDFGGENMSPSEKAEEWQKLSEEDKLKNSENYRKVKGEKGTVTTLENLKTKNMMDKFNELGVRWTFSPSSGFSMEINDLRKVQKYIKDELQRLEVDQNTLDNIELTEDYKSFINPAETIPSYTTISNLLWSMADKAVTSFKVNGKPLVQVSSAFFNKESRKAAYKNEDGTWTIVSTKEEYDQAVKEDKKLVMTSSELEFYRKGENGETIGMEVYLPNMYLRKVNDSRIKRGLNPLSEEELLSYLNKNPKLLEGIGFRIPTQATSSLEFFRIKGFLPEIFGNAVVVPSAITTKAGSDFDVDKLNTYLNNWKMGKNGMPVYEDYAETEDEYRRNYEKSFLPKTSLLNFIQREYERTQIKGTLETAQRAKNQSLNSLIDTIFGNNIETVAEEILGENEYPEGYTLQNLIDEAKEEQDTVHMSFEDFMNLPDFMRQSKGALENRYFDAIRTILKSPENFEYLLSPNSIEHIRQNRDEVFKALGKEAEDKAELDYTKFLSTEYIAEKRNQFTKGKYDIGIFAVAMTNFANSQIAGIGINEQGGVKSSDSFVFDTLNNSDISLPFKDLDMMMVNGKLLIPISALQDKSGALTMDKLSSYINGAVDVAKDPLIIDMGMHTDLAGVYVLMERMGLTGKTTALFMYQPIIRDFLKELLFTDRRSYFGYTEYGTQREIIEGLIAQYTDTAEESTFDPDYKFTDDQLADMISKGQKVKKGEAQWTSAEKKAQYQAFVNFLKMRMFSQHLLESIQGSNHDTASIRSPYIIMKKDLQMERSKEGNVVVQVTPTGLKNGTEALRDETSIGTDVALFKDYSSMLSKMNLFALQRENPRAALENIAKRIFRQNPFMTNDAFVAALREFEATMVDVMVNKTYVPNVTDTNLTPLYKLGEELFSLDSKYSIKRKLDYIKKNYPEFRNNYFLKNLEVNPDQNLGVYVMELSSKPSNNDVMTKELLTEGLMQLATVDKDEKPVIYGFYKSIIYAAYLQYGIKFSRRSFVDLLPVSTVTSEEESRQTPVALTDITRAALNKIDTEDFSNLDEQVQRAKWYKKDIVPQKTFMAIQFVAPDPKNPGQYTLENNPVWRIGSSKPPNKYSQIFFGRRDNAGEIKPFIHPIMVWGGYSEDPIKWERMPDIIKVPAIRPEYLVVREEFSEFGGVKITYQPSPVVAAMMKRGDYSYMFEQLFKKVGAENPSLGRAYISKANKKGQKSVNYLYKPINKNGAPSFNEILPVVTTASGTTVGTKSILNFPEFSELEDNELLALISDKTGKLMPVNKPEVASTFSNKLLKPLNAADVKQEEVSTTEMIAMTPDNIIKVAQGTKTTTIRSPKQAGQIGIPTGQEGIRLIGGTPYLIRNRGYLTIQQAGGLEAILKSEGLDAVSALKFQQTKDWIQGKGKLYVYDILSAPNQAVESTENEAPTEPAAPLGKEEMLEEAKKYSSKLSDINKIMFEGDPEGFLRFMAEQIYSNEGKNVTTFTPGTGLDSYPQELKEIATKLFPKSDFIQPDGKPPINPQC